MRVILRRPVVTERSSASAKKGEYTFWVAEKATKRDVARSVEEVFKVHVLEVRGEVVAAKSKKRGKKRTEVRMGGGKKMMVRLKEGEKIDLFSEFAEEKGK